MKKIDNLVEHDPENDQWGDCHRVCVAMLLGQDPETVPHFYRKGDKGDQEEVRREKFGYFSGLGLTEINIPYPDCGLDEILKTWKNTNPDAAFILGGNSRRGCGHSVVCCDGRIFHDPTGSGIVGPMDDGFYWITLFSPKAGTIGG